jgi:hypothetical protein
MWSALFLITEFWLEGLPDMSCLAGWSSNFQGYPFRISVELPSIYAEGFHGSPHSLTNVGAVS